MAAFARWEPPPIQSVVRARSETEAAWLLAEGREGLRPICGGTDLMLHIDRRKACPTGLIDIRRAGMDRVEVNGDAIVIGAATTAAQLSRSSELEREAAGLWEAAATLSVPTIRNMASLGGNLANASPAADMVPPVMAMGGSVHVRRGDDRRVIAVDALASGPGRTELDKGDLLTEVVIPRWAANSFHHFVKLGFRDAQIIAVVSLAFSVEMNGDEVGRVGIALGSVAPTVRRAKSVEAFLIGKRLTRAVAEEAVRLLAEDITPIDDLRSEATFRLKVAQSYLADALARGYVHSQGRDARGNDAAPALAVLKDPAPRPPKLAGARTAPLVALHESGMNLKEPTLRIVATSPSAWMDRDGRAVEQPPTSSAERSTLGASTKMAARKKTAKKTAKAPKKKATKKKAKKKVGKKKAKKAGAKKKAKKKVGKKKAKKAGAKKKAKKKAGKKKAKKAGGKKKAKKRASKKAAATA